MATSASFKQQCPSCEAMVPIRDANLIGRKIDCPKCKYRFVVEDPGTEAGEEEAAPSEAITKEARPGKKAGAKGAGKGKTRPEKGGDAKAKKEKAGKSSML